MPDLPTLTVTDPQATRMLAAYGSVDNYKAWLRNEIIKFVTTKEMQTREKAEFQQREIDRRKSIEELGGLVNIEGITNIIR